MFCLLATHRFSNPTNRLWIKERPQNVTGWLVCQILRVLIYYFKEHLISVNNINARLCEMHWFKTIAFTSSGLRSVDTVGYRPFLPFPAPPLWTAYESGPTFSPSSTSLASQVRDSVQKLQYYHESTDFIVKRTVPRLSAGYLYADDSLQVSVCESLARLQHLQSLD